jgi:hypothetical protein
MILCDIVIDKLREILGVVKFVSISINEETTINNNCRNPTLGKVGECNSHSQMWRLGSLRDSRKFRRRFEGSNLLALMRSLYQ